MPEAGDKKGREMTRGQRIAKQIGCAALFAAIMLVAALYAVGLTGVSGH